MIIGIGSDLIDIRRVERVIERHGEQFLQRVYTEREIRFCQGRRRAIEQFAAHWAAKEAVMKALGVGLGAIDWYDVEVVRNDEGAPALVITGRAAELAADRGVSRWLLTLTHTSTMAEAIAVAL